MIHAPPGFRDFVSLPRVLYTAATNPHEKVRPGTAGTTQSTASTAVSKPNVDKEAANNDRGKQSVAEPDREEESPSQQSDATVTSPSQPDASGFSKVRILFSSNLSLILIRPIASNKSLISSSP